MAELACQQIMEDTYANASYYILESIAKHVRNLALKIRAIYK